MLFRTVDHYFDNDDILLLDEKEKICDCFICYELLNENEMPIKLNNNSYYLKNCNCYGFIHKKCLDKWVNSNNSCPVCRISINKINYSISKNICVVIFYNNMNTIKKFGFVFLFIFFTLDFYLEFFNLTPLSKI